MVKFFITKSLAQGLHEPLKVCRITGLLSNDYKPNTCEIVLPTPADAPDTLEEDVVHVNVVPLAPLGSVMGMEVLCPEQMV